MFKFYAILENENGGSVVKGFEYADTRIATELAAEEFAKHNGMKVVNVYPVNNNRKQESVLTKNSKHRRATLGHR